MPRDNKLRFREPSLIEILGKQAAFAAALMLLAGAVAWWLAGWEGALKTGAIGTAVAVVLCWRHYRLETRNPTEGELDEQGRRHGRWLWRFPGGAIGRDVEYCHGLRHGSELLYFPDGRLYQEAHFENGEPNGPLKQWRANGELEFECDVRAGLAHGRLMAKDADGTRLEEHFEEGELHGPYREWHANGQLAEETTLTRGRLEGVYSAWYEDGTAECTGVASAGEWHGVWTWWHPNGERWIRGEYKWGARHGPFTEWADDGTVRQTAEFVAGYELGPARQPFEPFERSAPGGTTRWFFRGVAILMLLAVVRDVYLVVPLTLLLMTIGIHELGHLLAAKLVGIPIRRFRIGLGPIWRRRLRRGTIFEWSLLPVGGFVAEYMMRASEWNHARSVLGARRRGEPEPEYPEIDPDEPRQGGSHLVGSGRRLVFLLGGVTFNLLTAWLAIWAFHAGQPREADSLSAVTTASRHMAHLAGGIFGAISQDVQLLLQADTYATYRPSLLAGLSDEARAMFTPLPDDALATGSPDNRLEVDSADAAGEETDEAHEAGSGELSPTAKARRWAAILGPNGRLRGLLVLIFAMHFCIAAFNLLPIPPLDGYHCAATMLEAALGRHARLILRPLSLLGLAFLVFLVLASSYLLLRDLVMALFR